MARHWLYPGVSRRDSSGRSSARIALVPTVIIVRRLISPEFLPLLYAMVVAYFVDQLRNALMPDGASRRFLFFSSEMLVACLFHPRHAALQKLSATNAPRRTSTSPVRVYLHVAFFIFLAAGFANFFGYAHARYLHRQRPARTAAIWR